MRSRRGDVPTIQTPGARLLYTDTGHGPAVLLVQGAGVVGEGWRPQIDVLATSYRVLAFDHRGTGLSALVPGGDVSVAAMAGDARAVLDDAGVSRAHVVGHSMGGLVAQELALTEPGRVASLALLCTFCRGRQASRLELGLALAALRMRVGTRRARRRAALDLLFPPAYLAGLDRDALAEDLRPLFGHDLASQPSFVFRQLRAMAAYDRAHDLGRLAEVSTLVLSAREDRIALPGFGRALAAAIPGARYEEIAAAGHAVTIQCADRVNALLREHLDRVT
jgi:pimeloyl-ACP methyl ester carboxylesterase